MIKDYLARVQTADINQHVRRVMDPFFQRCKAKPGLEGIVELGGLATRAFSDTHSDVDASLFVAQEQPWLPMFEFYVPTPSLDIFAGIRFFEINVHQNTLAREYERGVWEEGKKEAYEEGVVIHDPHGRVTELIGMMVFFDDHYANSRKAKLCSAIGTFAPTNDFIADHLALNKIANQVVEVMYLSNREFRPHKKWRLEKARYLPDLPPCFDEMCADLYLVRDISQSDVQRRLSSAMAFLDHYTGHQPVHTEFGTQHTQHPICSGYTPHEQKRMMSLVMGQLYWLVDVNPLRQVARGFILNSHDLLNEGLGLSLEALRIAEGEPIRQNSEALNVIYPPVHYDESTYTILHPGIDRALLADALMVPDFSPDTVAARVAALQRITRPLQANLAKTGLVPEDPYHFAVRHCYFDRQLRMTTFAEASCPQALNDEDKRLYQGFVSLHLAGSKEELAQALRDPIPSIYSGQDLARIAQIAGDVR